MSPNHINFDGLVTPMAPKDTLCLGTHIRRSDLRQHDQVAEDFGRAAKAGKGACGSYTAPGGRAQNLETYVFC